MPQPRRLRAFKRGIHYRWNIVWASASYMTAGGKWSAQLSESTRQNLRSYFFDGLFAAASDSFYFTYLTLFALTLGASNSEIGWMTALASLSATLLLMPGAKMADQSTSIIRLVLRYGGIFGRIPLVLLALIPLVFMGKTAVWAVIALKVIMDGFRNLALPAWTVITADIVPLSWRGRYFATRNLAMGLATIFVTYGIGSFITRIGEPVGYQWALTGSFILGMVSTYFFGSINEPGKIKESIQNQSYKISALIDTLHSDRNFSAFFVYTSIWTFSLNLAGPFFNVYLARDLKATATVIGLTAVVGKISAIPAQRIFGILADRWGARKLMLWMGGFIPILPMIWFFVNSAWQAIPINIVGGILWAGYSLAGFNFLLEISPANQRPRYSAMYQISVTASTALGASCGGMIADRWGIPIIFLLSGIGRFAASRIFAKHVHQPEIISASVSQ